MELKKNFLILIIGIAVSMQNMVLEMNTLL